MGKICFLKYPNYFNYIFCVTINLSSELGIALFNMKTNSFTWYRNIQSYFNPDFQLSSILSPGGVILAGRNVADLLLPYSWLLQRWNYEGQLVFSKVVHTEYMLHMGGVTGSHSDDL